MTALRSVGLRELKNRLSEYVRDVRRGSRILVTDRDTVVAELRPPYGSPEGEPGGPWTEWVTRGELTPAARRRPAVRSPVTLPRGTARNLLDAERGE